ncbi:hypothetical protein ACEPAF_2902 [Sanghuangporus sanghuang]
MQDITVPTEIAKGLEDVEKSKADPDLIVHSEHSQGTDGTEYDNAIDEKRLVRRIDFTLIPWLSVLYLLCFLDRVGIGNAKLYGMEEDLNISDTQYLIALSMFFVPYALLEIPSNLCIRRLRPSIWLSSIMLFWGIATTCLGLVENFGGLLALRILLGIFEAGFLPGVTYYFSCWYKRDELGLRLAIFHSSVSVSGAFGGLLAAAISNMDGVGDKAAWSWIFILEGIVTVIAGATSYFLLQDFPETARFLSEQERACVIRRLQTDDQFSAGGEKLQWKNVQKSLTDYKTWLGTMTLIGFGGPMYAFSLFLPSIIGQLGYTATRANLLTVPVYIAASVISVAIGYTADRLKRRAYFTIGLQVLIGASYIILLCSRQPALSYFATYLAALGIFPGNPNTFAWTSNNVEGSYKRSVSIGLMICCGYSTNLTGIISSNTYRSKDTPWYTIGHAVTLGYVVVGLFGSSTMTFLLTKENARRDRGERDEVIGNSEKAGGDPRNGIYESVDAAKRDKGDEWSGYRYII